MNNHSFYRSAGVKALLWILLMFPVATKAERGYDYFNNSANYDAYMSANNVIHFVIPVWVEGPWNYHMCTNERGTAYVTFKRDDKSTPDTICIFRADPGGDNADSNNDIGRADVNLLINEAPFVVTSTYEGVDKRLPKGWSRNIMLKQLQIHPDTRATILEFDWHIPESVDTTFDVSIHASFERCQIVAWTYYHVNKEIRFAKFKKGQLITPLLFSPFLHMSNETGKAGYGYAGVPYSLFYRPKYFTTSLDQTKIATSSQSGNIYVMTNDTIQKNFNATFCVYRDEKEGVEATLQSTKVDIPPYHRIYDFGCYQELDSLGTFTGTNIVQWRVKNPLLEDIVPVDYFEVQRALKSDFSDAQQLGLELLRPDSSGTYEMKDRSRLAWTGHGQSSYNQSSDVFPHLEDPNFMIRDTNGAPVAKVHMRAVCTSTYMPSMPVYYRIRRSSASVWDWNSSFVHQFRLLKSNFLAPLADTLAPYTKDPNYEKNHRVNFQIKLDNREVDYVMDPDSLSFKYDFQQYYGVKDTMNFELYYGDDDPYSARYVATYRVYDQEGREVGVYMGHRLENNVLRVPIGYTIKYKVPDEWQAVGDSMLVIKVTGSGNIYSSISKEGNVIKWRASYTMTNVVDDLLKRYDHITRDTLMKRLRQQDGIKVGRCMWDRTANLVLIRGVKGTDDKMEFVIPQDSIKRQPDGSWIASYYDIADKACTDYTYAVRIDASRSDLRLQNPKEQSLPRSLSGPNLYFDEGADIDTLSVSYDDARSNRKTGVMLNWKPTNPSVDEYRVLRKPTNSSSSPDTIYSGVETTYFDTHSEPGKEYEYTVEAIYECNGKWTINSKSAKGRRSALGQIGGMIIMTDNCGMNGVRIALVNGGDTIKTYTTDATGQYLFDSIPYTTHTDRTYSVIPVATHAVFAYNHTSAQYASVSLTADNAVLSGVDFENVNVIRLSGRVLYQNTTIPVPGVQFLLSGDTVRRNGTTLKSGNDGNFELMLTKSQSYTLQAVKAGHHFAGNGFLQVETGKDTFALTKALDGVRFYDETKVRLVGRVAGGNDQRDLKHGFGLGRNNLGDNIQLVLQLEGDNTAHLVHDPNDPVRDTLHTYTPHIKLPILGSQVEVVGETRALIEKKRMTIYPDPATGEFALDIWPAKYKVIQASAQGYATLFAPGQGSEIVDLINAPTSLVVDTVGNYVVAHNAIYDRIYHAPIQVQLSQMIYGLEQAGYGEPEMEVSSFEPKSKEKLRLWTKNADGTVEYTLGHPVFYSQTKYQFIAKAYEDYYYNNEPSGTHDRVPWRGGKVTIRNGLRTGSETLEYALDSLGYNRAVWLQCDAVDVESSGLDALRTVTVSLEAEGNTVETDVFQGFVSGLQFNENELRPTESGVVLLDVVRDPPGSGSYAYVESGATYSFQYDFNYKVNMGLNITRYFGTKVNTNVGVSTMAGTYSGSQYMALNQLYLTIPIIHGDERGKSNQYQLATSSTISTSSLDTDVGSMADVFVGTMMSYQCGKMKAVTIIPDSLYQLRLPAINAGVMKVLAHGVDTAGKPYHLVTGEKIVMGTAINHDFTYTQNYVINTLIPRLIRERYNKLQFFKDSTEAKAAANKLKSPVYWYRDTTMTPTDTLPSIAYSMIIPDDNQIYTDEIAALNKVIKDWLAILIFNEKEKVTARTCGMHVGAHSLSNGTSIGVSDNYLSCASYNYVPQAMIAASNGATYAADEISGALVNLLAHFKGILGADSTMGGKTPTELIKDYEKAGEVQKDSKNKTGSETGAETGIFDYKYWIDPIVDNYIDARQTNTVMLSKTAGYSINTNGDLTVSVYRANFDSLWLLQTDATRLAVSQPYNDNLKYGSFVYFTDGGTTLCPHIEEERTRYYNKGTLLGNGTLWKAKPELSVNTYEVTNVPSDKRASFRVMLRNMAQSDSGPNEEGAAFSFSLDPGSNPNGAKVYMDGAPLINAVNIYLNPDQTMVKTIEVERGSADDYELSFLFSLQACPTTATAMNLAVHYMPTSTDVAISMPRQNWVLNTLSQQDSMGYYMPISIDGFDVHHKNFDHIEFQYKLATQSEEDWVTYCSFYDNDSIYDLATGNKAMIRNGVITPFRFYGEKDPIEQRYNLRAVSFCRYGSGFVTKSSPVITGTKDTRPPRVFGEPEPANGILDVGNYLRLQYNENIAGNYLDEDNNFSVVGFTNETGIASGSAVHFAGTAESYAATKVSRRLSDTGCTIDMMVRPSAPNADANFFSHGTDTNILVFGMREGRLYAQIGNAEYTSQKLTEPMLEFTRVLMTVDPSDTIHAVRFYLGTLEITDTKPCRITTSIAKQSLPLVFGRYYQGDMIEARLWMKPLSKAEIAATNNRHLTGYEQELLAYYRMNEGKGETMTDRANGATMYMQGCSWTHRKGISLALKANERVQLKSQGLGRGDIYDGTYMFWFRTDQKTDTAMLFSVNEKDIHRAVAIGMLKGLIVLHADTLTYSGSNTYDDGQWHHVVLSVNRTYARASLFVDGKMEISLSSDRIPGIQGAMYFGGGFAGNIDEFAVMEQALPKSLIETFDCIRLEGDEMGLVGYLPFEQQVLNPSGVLENVFSVLDQRIIFDNSGNIRLKKDTLIQGNLSLLHPDKTQNAPTTSLGKLSKLKFDWSFRNEELMINILNMPSEVNKQSLFVTVRDVEDLNGNPMPSPMMWTAFVDRNSLKWSDRAIDIASIYGDQDAANTFTVRIHNASGKRQSYVIESLPDWLKVDNASGMIQPADERIVTFTYNTSLPVGNYTDIVYLTDNDGLSEPLTINYEVIAVPPYEDVDKSKYPLNMSICGEVKLTIDGKVVYDTDVNDIVYAMHNNECVGKANITFDNVSNRSEVFLTVYGNADTKQKPIQFRLWQASTGSLFDLEPDIDLSFTPGNVYGCMGTPVLFTTSGSERQTIVLNQGWGWYSFNLDMTDHKSSISKLLSASQPWTGGDIIKNPTTLRFLSYSEFLGAFVGDLSDLYYRHIYMIHCHNGNTIQVSGNPLDADSMTIAVKGGGQWTAMPCMLNQSTSVTEALADYTQYATTGDMIKSHDRFATFSVNKRWIGDLTTLMPGEGYLFRRMAQGDQTIRFYNRVSAAPGRKRSAVSAQPSAFTNPSAATNMTMIAEVAISHQPLAISQQPSAISVFANGEKVGESRPIEVDGQSLYFLTIQSDQAGELQFKLEDGTILTPAGETGPYSYFPDAHYGSLSDPVVLIPTEAEGARKVIENDHLFIYRNEHKYDATGHMVH